MPPHEDLKVQLHSKKRTISLKTEEYRLNLISRIEFISSMLYKFLPNTHLYLLLLLFTMPLAISLTLHVIAQKITDTAHVRPQ
jgi:hypothetical protein